MTVTIDVSNHDALVDEVVRIVIRGLNRKQAVTVHAQTEERNLRFGSSGCFIADENGTVDISKEESKSGTYTGISPMGLFWSMRAAPQERYGTRLMKYDAATPLHIQLKVCDGHVSFFELYTNQIEELATIRFRRWYMAKNVRKIKVRSGRIRGYLFLPKGPGPFLGVIDMFGLVGTVVEFRAALLASRGFAALALPYLFYEDLPKILRDLQLEYFLEAIDWLSNRREVVSGHIGLLGVSKGGEIALHAGYYSSKVKAVVSINGAPFFLGEPMLYKGRYIGHSMADTTAAVYTDEGASYRNAPICEKENYLKIWEKDVKVLLVAGGDDQCLNPDYLKSLHSCYPASKRHNCKLLYYPGAGHLIEPPFAPHFRSTIKYARGHPTQDWQVSAWLLVLWGGSGEDHAFAQEDSWKHILEHFKTHLTPHTVEHLNCKL